MSYSMKYFWTFGNFSKNGRNLNKFKVQYHALFLTIVVFPFLFVIPFYFQQIKEAKEDLSRKGFKFDDTWQMM